VPTPEEHRPLIRIGRGFFVVLISSREWDGNWSASDIINPAATASLAIFLEVVNTAQIRNARQVLALERDSTPEALR
jgi:hypothetical protein